MSDDGVRVAVTNGESRLGWELYPRYVETANLFVALSRDKSAVGVALLPKRGAGGPGDVDRLREIFDRNAVRADRKA
ncbi:YcxB family protein [Streptomyces albus]|uniref:YcxB family protein n=1 Tax=Streptomyces albus TaxID=1888 RepID=UPI0004C56EFD|nr:YcxB family protein [Streptomyces albus]